MNELDDPVLRDRLSRYAGPAPYAPDAYVGFQARVRQAKRRRAAIWCGTAAAGALAVGALVSLDRGEPSAVRPAADTSVTVAASTTSTTTSTTTIPATIADTTAAAPPAETLAGSSDAGAAAAPPAGPGGGAPTTGAAPAPAPAPAPASTAFQSSAGGTITVQLVDGRLILVDAVPNPGYEARAGEDRSGRVRVRFVSGAGSSRITADVAGDGTITFSVDEQVTDDRDDGGWNDDDQGDDRDGNDRVGDDRDGDDRDGDDRGREGRDGDADRDRDGRGNRDSDRDRSGSG